MKRITWKRAQWGSVGYVNGVQVFSVQWGGTSDRERPYVLHATLPGISTSRYADEDKAQEMAETVFALCMEGLGATLH